MTVEDGVVDGGNGSAVSEWMQQHGHLIPVRRLGMPDHFVEHGTVSQLREIVGLDARSIAKAIQEMRDSTTTSG